MPGPDASVVDTLFKIGKQRGLSSREMLAVFETAAVESNYNNLPCGDQDSVGVFQQRPTMQVWGTYDEIMNVAHATNAFIDAMLQCAERLPEASAGQISQCAQVYVQLFFSSFEVTLAMLVL